MKKTMAFGTLFFLFIIMNIVFAGALEAILPEQGFKLQLEKKAIILDVREPKELSIGKIKGAINIPLSVMNNDRAHWDQKIAEIKKDLTILVYCHSGRRAEIVGAEIAKKGFRVLNMGSYDSWKLKNLPTE